MTILHLEYLIKNGNFLKAVACSDEKNKSNRNEKHIDIDETKRKDTIEKKKAEKPEKEPKQEPNNKTISNQHNKLNEHMKIKKQQKKKKTQKNWVSAGAVPADE